MSETQTDPEKWREKEKFKIDKERLRQIKKDNETMTDKERLDKIEKDND